MALPVAMRNAPITAIIARPGPVAFNEAVRGRDLRAPGHKR